MSKSQSTRALERSDGWISLLGALIERQRARHGYSIPSLLLPFLLVATVVVKEAAGLIKGIMGLRVEMGMEVGI